MSHRFLHLPGPVAVVLSGKVHETLLHAGTSADALITELSQLARSGTLPVRLDSARLYVYTSAWKATLYPTDFGDGFRLGHVAPMNFKDQQQLVTRALLVGSPTGWQGYYHVRDVPRGSSAHWQLLTTAWQQADLTPAPPTLPSHHAAHLDLLTEVIEASRDIEIARQRTAPAMPYRRVESTRELRNSVRGVYAFQLVRSGELSPGALVYVTDQPELRGRLLRVRDRQVTVRFDSTVDFRRIPQQGSLQALPSDRVYQAQLDAVQMLRTQRSLNPQLLSWLVDRRLTPFRPDTSATPAEGLDPDQLRAFASALTVPDLMLVLGPPGTGKTRTITEIAAACVARGQRVLVTSHTNRAVDNVLERLPEHVRVVRVGNEDAMTIRARGFMVEHQVERLREQILSDTEPGISRLSPFLTADQPASRWLSFAGEELRQAASAEADVQAHTTKLTAAIAQASAPVAAELANAGRALDQAHARMVTLAGQSRSIQERLAAAESRSSSGLFAFYFRWQATHRRQQLASIEQLLPAATSDHATTRQARQAVQVRADHMVAADPLVRTLRAAQITSATARDKALTEVERSLTHVRSALRPALTVPAGDPTTFAGWQVLHRQLTDALALATTRARLLAQWRDQVTVTEEQLHHELVRYADVVAATCIGTATTKLLADQEFDLAIVDEAGQIAAPDLLVPLVRSRRAVLVGDHQQLPPFLDEEVSGWANDLADRRSPAVIATLSDLLRRSEFERLYLGFTDANRAMLSVQRRMPEEIAGFASSAFYQGILRTEHAGGPPDPIFHSPLAMIDTADQPARQRAERPGRSPGGADRKGFINELEAKLIVALLGRHVAHYRDWAVIVPYRAQAELVGKLIGNELPGIPADDHVGTVDSFQGGERDLIIYGFTRSNHSGDIGFLRELRRINVAVTRARQQLVLVGDTATLGNARDPGFAALMSALITHLDKVGDRRLSTDIEAVLRG
jgi:hypothetical protein